MSDWTDERKARLEADIRGEPFDGVYLLTRQRADIRAALGEIRRLRSRVEELGRGRRTLDDVATALRYFAGRAGYLPTLAEHAATVIAARDRAERGLKITSETAQRDLARAEAAEAKLALWESLPASMREYGIETGDLPVNVGAAIAQAIGTLRAKVQRLRGVLGLVLTETGLQAHKPGCPERLRRPAQWDQTLPCAGCAAEAALRTEEGR